MAARPETTVVRIRRKGGEVVQDCDVYIGRRMFMGGWELPASDWANPFSVKLYGSNEVVCNLYETWIRTERPDLMARIPELRGKTLGCWCKPAACHGDVLIRLVAELDTPPAPPRSPWVTRANSVVVDREPPALLTDAEIEELLNL